MAAAAGSSIVVHKQAATRQRKSRLAASDEVDKVLRQELIEVAALWSIPALDKAIAQHAGDDDDHEDEDGDDHVDDGLTLIRLNFVDVSISGSTYVGHSSLLLFARKIFGSCFVTAWICQADFVPSHLRAAQGSHCLEQAWRRCDQVSSHRADRHCEPLARSSCQSRCIWRTFYVCSAACVALCAAG